MTSVFLLYATLIGASSDADLRTSVLANTSGGALASGTTNAPWRVGADLSLVPRLALTNRWSNGDVLDLSYQPSFVWRLPQDTPRPLIFQQLNLTHTTTPCGRCAWQWAITGTLGEINTFRNAPQVPASSQGSEPIAPPPSFTTALPPTGIVLRYAGASAQSSLGYAVTRRLQWLLSAQGAYSRPLGTPEGYYPEWNPNLQNNVDQPDSARVAPSLVLYPEQGTAGLGTGLSYQLTPRDTVGFYVQGGYWEFVGLSNYVGVEATGRWQRRFAENTRLGLEGGAFFVHTPSPVGVPPTTTVLPSGTVNASVDMLSNRQWRLSADAQGGLAAVFNGFAGTVQSRGITTINLALARAQSWTTRLGLNASTPIREAVTRNVFDNDATLQAIASIAFPTRDGLQWQLGTRFAVLRRVFGEDAGTTTQREWLLFFGLGYDHLWWG